MQGAESTTSQVSACAALTFKLFARAARATRLYNSGNAALDRMMGELETAMQSLLAMTPSIAFRVRPEAFVFEDVAILEESNIDDSIPFAYYRDGIRRIELTEGLSRTELLGILKATSQVLSRASSRSDIASLLWELNAEHLHYVVIDTTIITDSPQGSQGHADGPVTEIDGVLRTLYGSQDAADDERISVHLDEQDLPAKRIADQLSPADDMAPGLYPSSEPGPQSGLSYEPEPRFREIGASAFLQNLSQPLPEALQQSLAQTLIAMLDAALLADDFMVARAIVLELRKSKLPSNQIDSWLDRAITRPRIAHLVNSYADLDPSSKPSRAALAFLRACSSWATTPLLEAMLEVENPKCLHDLSDVALELGVFELAPLRAMLGHARREVQQDAIYILSHLPREDAQEMLSSILSYGDAELRLALAQTAMNLEGEFRLSVVTQLLSDPEDNIKGEAAQILTKLEEGLEALDRATEREALLEVSLPVKQVLLQSYAALGDERAQSRLVRYVKDGDRVFAKRDSYELALAAVWGLAKLRTVTSVEVLKRASKSRRNRLREAALAALEHMRRHG